MAYKIEPGMKIGKWTLIEAAPTRKKVLFYLCKCQCGFEHEVSVSNLKRGKSLSCKPCAMKARSMNTEAKTYTLSALDQLINKHLKW